MNLKSLFVSPAVVECQMCGVSKAKSKMLWGYSFWFCSAEHRDEYWNVSERFEGSTPRFFARLYEFCFCRCVVCGNRISKDAWVCNEKCDRINQDMHLRNF